ncbi:MAG: PTS glucose transporter subunit IIA, partial [Solobacterium sp.]|nr:PTS glucose transporter subunit IIA [Solobacterium sp.]
KEEKVELSELNVSDSDIVAIADGELIDIVTINDPVFSSESLGRSVAFKYEGKVVLCAPANGTLSVLFPTGHAYAITTKEGVEVLVHCGIETVNAKGDGFRLLGKKQGDTVKAGDPIVEVDFDKLSQTYDMSTMLIITDAKGKEINFIEPQTVSRGQTLLR